ncbi:MAG: glycosyl transferase family 2 [Snowella sp.]|jgi:biliverdin reductase|nr:MAG: glycosyl transferase family 2 [Snowella sp.]
MTQSFSITAPLKVGIVGTGYAAQRRAEAIQTDERSQLCFVTGNTPEHTDEFCQTFGINSLTSWQQLVNHSDLDLVIIGTINRDHGLIAQAALQSGKHVIIEYPLALDYLVGKDLLELAKKQNKLLHIEHIELLGGVHQALRRYLPEIGEVFYARYATIMPQNPAPRRWTYHSESFGFPLIAALSRLHRLTDLFGSVVSVTCQSRFWDAPETGYFRGCFCNAQLQFQNGLMADTVYAKGEICWQGDRSFVLHGDQGTLSFDGEQGKLIRGEEMTDLEVGSRRGLFAMDTQKVLDHLFNGSPLYVQPEASLYALQVAEAAYQSSKQGKTIFLA